jgi:hypothetical protein
MGIFSFKKDEEPKEPTPKDEPKDFVPKKDFETFMSDFNSFKDTIMGHLVSKPNTPSSQTPVKPVEIEDVSDEDYKKAIREGGEGAEAVVSKRMQAEIKRSVLSLRSELDGIKNVGLSSIANLTRQTLKAKPYYEQFKKEIDSAIDQLSPEAQLNPDVLNKVYSMVVGDNADALIEQRTQEALRKLNAQPQSEEPQNFMRRAKSSKGEEIPGPEEVWGAPGMNALEARFGGKDEAAVARFLKTQGYSTWEKYYEECVKPFEGR